MGLSPIGKNGQEADRAAYGRMDTAGSAHMEERPTQIGKEKKE